MKIIILITTALITLISCKKEEPTPTPVTPVKNCNCDRIAKIVAFTTIASTPEGKPNNHATIYTVNDCTGLNDYHTFNSKDYKYSGKIGECYH